MVGYLIQLVTFSYLHCTVLVLRSFQHTELEHTPKRNLYQQAINRDSGFIVGERGIAERVCDIGVETQIFGSENKTFPQDGSPSRLL